jgi:hypothetical protein
MEVKEQRAQASENRWDLFSDTIIAGMDDGSMGMWRSNRKNRSECLR